jgi:hypothetical protein
MGRQFDVVHGDRALRICVLPVDEAWELWLCEHRRRLAHLATVPVDKALDGWRNGGDVILQTVEAIRAALKKGEIVAPAATPGLAECPD